MLIVPTNRFSELPGAGDMFSGMIRKSARTPFICLYGPERLVVATPSSNCNPH